jgi:hypothetical protein
MSSFSTFIRWCGLLAIVGALIFASRGLLASPGNPKELLPLLLGMFAAIAGLHTLQRERYRLWGALSSLTSFVGVALLLASGLLDLIAGQRLTISQLTVDLLIIGAWVAALGLVTLGVVTIWARVLPWWCGVSIILGSPPAVFVVLAFLAFVGSTENPLTLPALVLGIAWTLVGYAIFRQARVGQTQQTSRVR